MVFEAGPLTLFRCTFQRNTASGNACALGHYSALGPLRMEGCLFRNNTITGSYSAGQALAPGQGSSSTTTLVGDVVMVTAKEGVQGALVTADIRDTEFTGALPYAMLHCDVLLAGSCRLYAQCA